MTTTFTKIRKVSQGYTGLRTRDDRTVEEEAELADKAFQDAHALTAGAPVITPEPFGPTSAIGRNGRIWKYYADVNRWKEIG